MKQIFVLGVFVALAACKSADGKPAASPEPAKPTMESVRAEACSCTDEACADRVLAELQVQRMIFEAAYAEATTCVQKFQPDPGEQALQKMGEFKDQICACRDKACVDKVQKDMMEWAMANMEMLKEIKPTKEQEERADKIDDEMDACKERVSPDGP